MKSETTSMTLRAGGIVCIHLVDCPTGFASAMLGEFGSDAWEVGETANAALVLVRFRPLEPPPEAHFVGRSSAISDDVLYASENGKWARIPLGRVLEETTPFEVVADPSYDPIRLMGYILEPLMKVRGLLEGHAFVHSSAADIAGRAVLMGAWGNTGKTNILLHYAREGHRMLSDDWSLLRSDGKIAGYPRPVNLMNYNLDSNPELRSSLSAKRRCAYEVDRFFRRHKRWLSAMGGAGLRVADLAGRVLELAANSRLPLDGYQSGEDSGLQAAAILEVHKLIEKAEPVLRPITAESFASSAATCFVHENQRLVHLFQEFAYAQGVAETLTESIRKAHYRATLQNLDRAGCSRLYSLGIPARASIQRIRECAELIQKISG